MIKNFVIFYYIIVGILVVAFIANCAANWLESQPTPVDQRFVVVDTYKGCDVVEYAPINAARYYYFLHCEK